MAHNWKMIFFIIFLFGINCLDKKCQLHWNLVSSFWFWLSMKIAMCVVKDQWKRRTKCISKKWKISKSGKIYMNACNTLVFWRYVWILHKNAISAAWTEQKLKVRLNKMWSIYHFLQGPLSHCWKYLHNKRSTFCSSMFIV